MNFRPVRQKISDLKVMIQKERFSAAIHVDNYSLANDIKLSNLRTIHFKHNTLTCRFYY